jgi:hypothetical protein
MTKETIESKVAQAVLQQPVEILIGDTIYQVPPPSVATLILASEAISGLPSVKLDPENVAFESLYIAKDCRGIGDILAILILGAKHLTEIKKIVKKRLFGLLKEESEVTIDKKKELAEKILLELSPKQVSNTFATLFSKMELAFFFGTITSLIEINQLRATKTIASGQS